MTVKKPSILKYVKGMTKANLQNVFLFFLDLLSKTLKQYIYLFTHYWQKWFAGVSLYEVQIRLKLIYLDFPLCYIIYSE